MPDLASRTNILKAVLRKSPVSNEVDLDYLARHTDRFSGTDLTEICQRAAKLAVRESIEKERIREAALEAGEDIADDEEEDLVPEITTAHFELAMRDARRSVSDADLAKYSSFAQTMQQQRAAMNGGQGVDNFRFPARAPGAAGDNNAGAGAGVAAADSDDDVDLYS